MRKWKIYKKIEKENTFNVSILNINIRTTLVEMAYDLIKHGLIPDKRLKNKYKAI